MTKHIQLNRGDLVQALKYLEAADTLADTLGVCFEPANYHEDNGGPMVRFINGHCCNVYPGWVEKVND